MKALVDLASIELPLIITIGWDLSALNYRAAQVKAVVHWESKVWAPKNREDIRLWSSIKACSKGNSVLLVLNLGTLICAGYSSIMFIPAKQRIDYRKVAASKYSPVMSMPSTTSSWLREWLNEYSFVVIFNQSYLLPRDHIYVKQK